VYAQELKCLEIADFFAKIDFDIFKVQVFL